MSLLLENINKIVTLTPEEEQLILTQVEVKHYKAKSLLLKAEEVSRNTYFVQRGVVRSFTINDQIIEHVLHFACEGWWIGDMHVIS